MMRRLNMDAILAKKAFAIIQSLCYKYDSADILRCWLYLDFKANVL